MPSIAEQVRLDPLCAGVVRKTPAGEPASLGFVGDKRSMRS